jgi:general secretion pathway protein D
MTLRPLLPAMLGLALLAGCTEPREAERAAPQASPGPGGGQLPGVAGLRPATVARPVAPSVAPERPPRAVIGSRIYRGTGPAAAGQRPAGAEAADPGGEVALNFNNAEVAEVARAVLGDTLGLAFVVDPGAAGQMTLETPQPVPRSSALAVFEAALRPLGLAVAQQPGGVFAVIQASAAQRTGIVRGGAGYGTEAVVLRHVSAAAMKRLLEPLLPEGQLSQTDAGRNLILVTGTAAERRSVRETVAQFDVDWMRGMSFGLFGLRQVPARRMVEDLNALMGGENSTLAGLVRLVALERQNAVLAVSGNAGYLEQIQAWIGRLDREGDADERRVFVYAVQNGRASDLARTLSRAFGLAGAESGSRSALAGGLGAGSAGFGGAQAGGFGLGGGASSGQGGGLGGGQGLGQGAGQGLGLGLGGAALFGGAGAAATGAPRAEDSFGGGGAAFGAGGAANQIGGAAGLTVTADEINNALVIVGTGRQYDIVEAALRRLDVLPTQVLIEAAVTEVTLTNDLRFGLQWALRSGNASGLLNQNTSLSGSTAPGSNFQLSSQVLDLGIPVPNLPGFSFLYSAPNISVVLDALDRITRVNVLSSPQVLVLNNQTAALQVGNQVPVTVGTAQSTLTSGSPIVSQLQYRDTGVILHVTPRVNESGLVLMDIQQEVSSVVNSLTSTTSQVQSPTFQQRRLASTVAVQDGQTIALGGLIRDSVENSNSGLPGLSSIPWLGGLFGNRSNAVSRTELLVLLTPRVVRNPGETQQASDELRARFRELRPLPPPPRGALQRLRALR